jgi:hypothetical protein
VCPATRVGVDRAQGEVRPVPEHDVEAVTALHREPAARAVGEGEPGQGELLALDRARLLEELGAEALEDPPPPGRVDVSLDGVDAERRGDPDLREEPVRPPLPLRPAVEHVDTPANRLGARQAGRSSPRS